MDQPYFALTRSYACISLLSSLHYYLSYYKFIDSIIHTHRLINNHTQKYKMHDNLDLYYLITSTIIYYKSTIQFFLPLYLQSRHGLVLYIVLIESLRWLAFIIKYIKKFLTTFRTKSKLLSSFRKRSSYSIDLRKNYLDPFSQ